MDCWNKGGTITGRGAGKWMGSYMHICRMPVEIQKVSYTQHISMKYRLEKYC